MVKRLLLILSLIIPLGVAGNEIQTLQNSQIVRYRLVIKGDKVSNNLKAYLNWLQMNQYDVAGVNESKSEIEVITDQEGLGIIQQHRIPFQIIETKDPMAKAGLAQTRIDARYLNPQKIETQLKKLAAQYPDLTRLEQIGTSHQGRAIWALLISDTPKNGDIAYHLKPTMIFDGMHHAREIMSPEVVLDVADALLKQKNNFRQRVIQNWNIWIVPMLNVDGNVIVWNQDNWWRKNARSDGGKVFGVDINRNYPFKWNFCSGSSGATSNDAYRGPSEGSEPETQALLNVGKMANPVASFSYHSYSEMVLYPFGCNGVVTGDNGLHAKIGKELAALLPKDSGKGNYTVGTPWQLLYSVDGDSMGFMHSEFGALSFTFEVNQSFQPGYELREPTVQKHRKAWAYFLDRMSKNLLTLQVEAGGAPVEAAVIDVSTIKKIQGEKPYRTSRAGTFFKVLDPGTYTITVQLKDGRSQQVQVTMAGSAQSKLVGF